MALRLSRHGIGFGQHRRRLYSVSDGATWGARLNSHQYTNLFTGQVTRVATISARRHGVVPYELHSKPRLTPGIPCVTLRLRNGAGFVAQGRFRRDWAG